MATEAGYEDYRFFGTPIDDEEVTRANQYRKAVKDPATTRNLPAWKQEVTDAQGRRRFHGAFTGGFSAGHFNTVGSAEGWAPSSFRSSRRDRGGAQAQTAEQFMDEDELEEAQRTRLQPTAAYDTFGAGAAEVARWQAAQDASRRPSAIPGLLPDELVAPVAQGIGVQLLQRMGWRQGKGVGASAAAAAASGGGGGQGVGRSEGGVSNKWGPAASVGVENAALHLVKPKTDVHGLGFDPFKGAEEFRAAKLRRLGPAPGAPPASAPAAARRRGIAFGVGAMDEDDTVGELEDYVTHDDVESYGAGAAAADRSRSLLNAAGLPLTRGPRLERSLLGDRLALQGYDFELGDEEEEEEERRHGRGSKRRPLALGGGSAPPALLESRQAVAARDIIPGFVKASADGGMQRLQHFPPPAIPPGWRPAAHMPPPPPQLPTGSGAYNGAAGSGGVAPAPARVDPPSDLQLRKEIDQLAFFVAAKGVIFEAVAREAQRREGHRTFLLGDLSSPGSGYYQWKLHALRSLMAAPAAQQQRQAAERGIGQRSNPLTADERGAILGETPLSKTTASAAGGGGEGLQAGPTAVHQPALQPVGQAGGAAPLARSLLNVASADRQRLQALLGSTFVRGETQQEMQGGAGEGAVQGGLRPGAAAVGGGGASGGDGRLGSMPSSLSQATAAAGAGFGAAAEHSLAPQPQQARRDAKIITAADLSRPGAAHTPGALPPSLPVRRSEDWRPVPLLCKRLNAPDPCRGRPQEIQMSKFRTDHLALPDTAAAGAALAGGGQQQQQLAPQAEQQQARQQQHHQHQQQTMQQHQQQAVGEVDAGDMADAFLSSLLGGPTDAAGTAAPSPHPAAAAGLQPPLPSYLDGSQPWPLFLAEEQQQAEGGAPFMPAPGSAGAGEEREGASADAGPLPAAPAERPIDLFKAIFEDSDDSEEEEEEREEANAPDTAPPGQQQQQQQAQQQHSSAQGPAAFGLAKLREPARPSAGAAGGGIPATAASDGGGEGGAAGAVPAIDEATRLRIEAALKALKAGSGGGKRHKKERKEKKKDRSRDRSRDRAKDRDGGSKHRSRKSDHKSKQRSDRKAHKKHRHSSSKHRRRSSSAGDTDSSGGREGGGD